MLCKTPVQTESRRPGYPRQAGFTLVELMVGLALGMIITVVVSSVYVGQRLSSTLGKEAASLQEDGSRALDALARDLRQAGDFNCAKTAGINLVTTNVSLADTVGIRGFTSLTSLGASGLSGASAVKTALEANASNNAAQVVAVTGTFESQSPLLEDATTTATRVSVNHQDFAAGQKVVLSDCVNASVLSVSSYAKNDVASGGVVTFSGAVGGASSPVVSYRKTTPIARIATAWWFFGKPTFGSDVSWPKGLYRVDGDIADASNGTGFKLISSQTEDVVFTFDSDISDPPDGVIDHRNQTAATLTDATANWQKVRRIKMELLLKSVKDVFPETQTYYFNGTSTSAGDKKMYLPLELSTTLRNMY